jgi:hypothetical protein
VNKTGINQVGYAVIAKVINIDFILGNDIIDYNYPDV